MPRLMLDRKISVPPGYAERGCVLVSYRLPLLRHCFALCSDSADESSDDQKVQLMAFFLIEAQRLAKESVGDPQAFLLVHSGQSVRKRASWHLHVFVIRNRWQKAWVHAVLALKNTALAGYSVMRRRASINRRAPSQGARCPSSTR